MEGDKAGSVNANIEKMLMPRMYKSLKRTYALFTDTPSTSVTEDYEAVRLKLYSKVGSEYSSVKDGDIHIPVRASSSRSSSSSSSSSTLLLTDGSDRPIHTDYDGRPVLGSHDIPSQSGVPLTQHTATSSISDQAYGNLLHSIPSKRPEREVHTSASIVEYRRAAGIDERFKAPGALSTLSPGIVYTKPEWHAPWKLMRVISGHTGWVRCLSVDISNEWFVTGSRDATIKVWDLASGVLKVTLTGHISPVRGLAVSPRHPYLFSAGEDKKIKCWDLECNKVIRDYHGHLSAIYALSLHPTLDVLITGGRDSTARVWDIRTKQAVHVLAGHTNTVCSIESQAADPQVITGSHDSTVKLWDLAAGKCMTTLTNHKKSVRGLALHPREFSFASGAPDNIKQWKLPEGQFIKNLSGHNAIVNCLAVNEDNVLVSGADNGTMAFWDWKTGYQFQQLQSQVQPGSLDSEAAIFAMGFDRTGSRLITCEGDKTIKIWKEDENATEETHPVKDWRPSRSAKKY